MHTELKEKLWAYIIQNNPELMFELQEAYGVGKYLDDKIASVTPTLLNLLNQETAKYAVIEICLNELTADLKPSRYNRITSILSEEFETLFTRLKENGLLTFEGVNLVEHCKETFEEFNFNEENEDDNFLYYKLVGLIAKYFEDQKKEVVAIP